MRKKTQTFCTSTCSLSFGESGFLKRKLGSQSWPVVRVVLHRYSLPFIIQKQDVLDEGCRHLRKKTLSRNAFPYIPDLLSATIHLTGILCTTIKPLSLSLSRLSLKNLVASRIGKGMSHFKRGKRKYPLHLHPSCQRRLERWRRRASTERVISKIHDVPISSSSMRDSSSSLDLLETVQ